MKKLINSIFLVSGTAIGAGLIALPLSAANIGIFYASIISLISFFVAYQTSCIAINLCSYLGKGASIVYLSEKISGKAAFLISITTFYILSFALLGVYFFGTADILRYFSQTIDNRVLIVLCSVLFYFLFSLKSKYFNTISSALFGVLIICILFVMFSFYNNSNTVPIFNNNLSVRDFFYFLPVIFTSFGVQNVCPYIFTYLENDVKRVKKAFFIGTMIPAVVYVCLIYLTLNFAYTTDISFFNKILAHNVSAGELVNFLCKISKSNLLSIFFKILTLFAIITSAMGIGIGLICSFKEIMKNSVLIRIIVVLIPTITIFSFENTFVGILSFGGVIATVFVIFMPLYLSYKINKQSLLSVKSIVCLIFGVLVAISYFY